MAAPANRLILGTNQGLLMLQKNGRGWELACDAYPGIPVSHAMTDRRTGILCTLLDHGLSHTTCRPSSQYILDK